MGKYIVNGGKRLCGEVNIQGSKNSALPILFATLITDGQTVLSDVPDISDVGACIEILRYFGTEIEYYDKTTLKIDTKNVCYRPCPTTLTTRLRASSYLLGSLTAKFGKCEFEASGGCDFGSRPLNMHYQVLTSLGATEKNGVIEVKNELKGAEIVFKSKSVGATVNAIICAAKSKGTTVIKNAACEPHVNDLACFLNHCGAEIIGAGTSTVSVIGKDRLLGTRYTVCSDMIEAGTFLVASLMTKGKIICKNAPLCQLKSLFVALKDVGAEISIKNGDIIVFADKINPTCVITAPYPDFPTDLQPQISALLGLAKGESVINETVFSNRFAYVSELQKAGFKAQIEASKMKISGINRYTPCKMTATDLRGGAAMVLAALNSDGESEIINSELIERGYSDLVQKLTNLGADIKRC